MADAFVQSIQKIMARCVSEMEEEARRYTIVARALATASATTTAATVATASATTTTTAVPTATVPKQPELELRVNTLENIYTERIQKMIHGFMEDVCELHDRVDKLQNPELNMDGDIDAFSGWNEDNFPIPWRNDGFSFQTNTNEVVSLPTTTKDIVIHLEMPKDSVVVPERETEPEPKPESKPEPEPEPKPEPKPESKPEPEPEPEVEEEEEVEEEAEEEAEEEDESLQVSEFEFNNKTYYKDDEGNVYTANSEGEVDDTPIGRWLEKKQIVKFYPVNNP